MTSPHHVFLIPGFFGFANLGDFAYFGHVSSLLTEVCRVRGMEVRVEVVASPPTASLRRRAARLAEAISRSVGEDDAPIHLIGHSSGGLDARLFTAPGVSLPTTVDVERYARQVRSVVTVATPHLGTPLAGFFNGLLGQHLLRVLSLATIYTLRRGRLPTWALLRLTGVFAAVRSRLRASDTLLDQLYRQLLSDFSEDRRLAVEEFFLSVGSEQDLLPQITPAGMDMFSAAATDRPGVRYGSVVSCARRPGLRSAVSAGLLPYAQATHALYAALHRLTASFPAERLVRLTPEQDAVIRRAYAGLPDNTDNDGIVPTLSQVHGEVIHAARADHLDVIGHFSNPALVPPHHDWLTSGTGFTRYAFDSAWSDVIRFLMRPA